MKYLWSHLGARAIGDLDRLRDGDRSTSVDCSSKTLQEDEELLIDLELKGLNVNIMNTFLTFSITLNIFLEENLKVTVYQFRPGVSRTSDVARPV